MVAELGDVFHVMGTSGAFVVVPRFPIDHWQRFVVNEGSGGVDHDCGNIPTVGSPRSMQIFVMSSQRVAHLEHSLLTCYVESIGFLGSSALCSSYRADCLVAIAFQATVPFIDGLFRFRFIPRRRG